MQAVIRLCYYAMIDKTLFNVVLTFGEQMGGTRCGVCGILGSTADYKF